MSPIVTATHVPDIAGTARPIALRATRPVTLPGCRSATRAFTRNTPAIPPRRAASSHRASIRPRPRSNVDDMPTGPRSTDPDTARADAQRTAEIATRLRTVMRPARSRPVRAGGRRDVAVVTADRDGDVAQVRHAGVRRVVGDRAPAAWTSTHAWLAPSPSRCPET